MSDRLRENFMDEVKRLRGECSRCSNEARYVNIHGAIFCGVHDAMNDVTSVRFSDVAKLVELTDNILHFDDPSGVLEELAALLYKRRPQ